jgi:glycerol-3-phosphate dehydrogenase
VLPLPGRISGAVSAAVETARRAHPDVPADVLDHLVRTYGSRFERVIAFARRMRGGFDRLHAAAPVIAAQLAFGAGEEDARTEDDLLWRRTELGARGLITSEARQTARAALGGDGLTAVTGSA